MCSLAKYVFKVMDDVDHLSGSRVFKLSLLWLGVLATFGATAVQFFVLQARLKLPKMALGGQISSVRQSGLVYLTIFIVMTTTFVLGNAIRYTAL